MKVPTIACCCYFYRSIYMVYKTKSCSFVEYFNDPCLSFVGNEKDPDSRILIGFGRLFLFDLP